jgi:hypothetical protein
MVDSMKKKGTHHNKMATAESKKSLSGTVLNERIVCPWQERKN